jgi:Asp-tRNA(Asn)/Glu-tRNA(Gln) amidotransferase A subunit family amidase
MWNVTLTIFISAIPVGIQIVAPLHQDERLFACARWIWQRLDPG